MVSGLSARRELLITESCFVTQQHISCGGRIRACTVLLLLVRCSSSLIPTVNSIWRASGTANRWALCSRWRCGNNSSSGSSASYCCPSFVLSTSSHQTRKYNSILSTCFFSSPFLTRFCPSIHALSIHSTVKKNCIHQPATSQQIIRWYLNSFQIYWIRQSISWKKHKH